MSTTRSYEELRRIETYRERYDYLRIGSSIGIATFGGERWMNQQFYTSREWRQLRWVVIARDNGCDLGVEGYEIHDRVIIHHMNPMTVDDLRHGAEMNLDPDYLITVSETTHNAIHYGDERMLRQPYVARRAGDTKLWGVQQW